MKQKEKEVKHTQTHRPCVLKCITTTIGFAIELKAVIPRRISGFAHSNVKKAQSFDCIKSIINVSVL